MEKVRFIRKIVISILTIHGHITDMFSPKCWWIYFWRMNIITYCIKIVEYFLFSLKQWSRNGNRLRPLIFNSVSDFNFFLSFNILFDAYPSKTRIALRILYQTKLTVNIYSRSILCIISRKYSSEFPTDPRQSTRRRHKASALLALTSARRRHPRGWPCLTDLQLGTFR